MLGKDSSGTHMGVGSGGLCEAEGAGSSARMCWLWRGARHWDRGTCSAACNVLGIVPGDSGMLPDVL